MHNHPSPTTSPLFSFSLHVFFSTYYAFISYIFLGIDNFTYSTHNFMSNTHEHFARQTPFSITNTLWPIWNTNKKNDMIQPCDTTQVRSDSDFGIKFSTVQFYAIEHNSKSNYWLELKLYQTIPEVFFYVGVNVQVNRSLEMTCDIGQNRLYEFCYLLSFDLWTFYLAMILFLKRSVSMFWEFSSSTIFN